MTKKDKQRAAIYSHGVKLKAVFGLPMEVGAAALAKRVHRLEMEAHRLAEAECSRPLPEGYSEKKEASIMRRLDAILGFSALKIPVFYNGDPRGCALKIDDAYMREHNVDLPRDMGGFGMLAPEF